jgi:hypothetical protein
MFNYFGKLGLPTGWNTLLMKSLYKHKGQRDDPNSYRGISIMGALPKLFSTALLIEMECISVESKYRANN